MASAGPVLAHWYRLIEGLTESPRAFYAAVEEAIGRRQVPDAHASRVEWAEAGAFSARREYLRLVRARHGLDICGAPFGTGFFVSWWLTEVRPSPLLPTFVAVLSFAILYLVLRTIGGATLGFVGVVGLFVGLGSLMSAQGEKRWHAYLLAVFLLGPLWERLFLPPTYYRIDTANMFQSAVHTAVLEVIDDRTTTKGLPRLSELDRKPILQEFYRRR